MNIQPITENKKQYLDLLLLADEQESMIDRYLDRGDMFALFDEGVKSVCVVVQIDKETCELKNIATDPRHQCKGYGKTLIEFTFEHYKNKCKTMLVGTGESPTIIAFYESLGFRRSHIVKNFFTENYDHPIFEDGIQLVDMIYLRKDFGDDPMADLFELSTQIEQRARKIVEETKVIDIWKSAGAEINLVGSLKMGLMMKHRDIDFHIYSPSLNISEDFFTMAKLAANRSVTRIEYINLVNTDESCIEWHAWCRDQDDEIWQLDMIHILKGSFYDGYMERVSDRIMQVMTPEMKRTILQLKYDTPDEEKIAGIEYYQAVIRDGVHHYDDFRRWRKTHPLSGVLQWMP